MEDWGVGGRGGEGYEEVRGKCWGGGGGGGGCEEVKGQNSASLDLPHSPYGEAFISSKGVESYQWFGGGEEGSD